MFFKKLKFNQLKSAETRFFTACLESGRMLLHFAHIATRWMVNAVIFMSCSIMKLSHWGVFFHGWPIIRQRNRRHKGSFTPRFVSMYVYIVIPLITCLTWAEHEFQIHKGSLLQVLQWFLFILVLRCYCQSKKKLPAGRWCHTFALKSSFSWIMWLKSHGVICLFCITLSHV